MIPLLSDQDEFLHTLMHAAQLQAGIRLNVVPGHVASYDPIHHRITCVLPTYIYPQTGEMRVSGWVPLFSIGCGSGWGIQIVPYGGSTQENLGAGEQVWLLVVDMETAAYVAAGFTWNAVMGTPFPNAQGGDIGLKDGGGDSIFMDASAKTISVTTPMTRIGPGGATLVSLVKETFQALFNEHTHGGGPVPDQQMTSDHLTSSIVGD